MYSSAPSLKPNANKFERFIYEHESEMWRKAVQKEKDEEVTALNKAERKRCIEICMSIVNNESLSIERREGALACVQVLQKVT